MLTVLEILPTETDLALLNTILMVPSSTSIQSKNSITPISRQRKVISSFILDKLLEAQAQSITEFIEGKDIQFFPTLKLLIFGDLKKHTFKYQFLSTANPVENY